MILTGAGAHAVGTAARGAEAGVAALADLVPAGERRRRAHATSYHDLAQAMRAPSHQPFGDASVEHAADLEPQQLDFSTWRDVVKDGYVPDATTHMPTQDAAPVPRLRLAWH